MKILHIVDQDTDKTLSDVVSAQEANNEVKILRLDSDGVDYDSVIDEIETTDKVISWLAEN